MATGYKSRTVCCINHVGTLGFGPSGLISVIAALGDTVEELPVLVMEPLTQTEITSLPQTPELGSVRQA